MPATPLIINQEAAQTVIKYTKGDDLVVTADVVETVSGSLVPITWGAASGVGNIRGEVTDAAVVTTFNVNATVNGKLTISLTAAQTASLGNSRYKFSIQITRNSLKRTYWAGTLEPKVEA